LEATDLIQAQTIPRDEAPGTSLLDMVLLLRRRKISFRRTIVGGRADESDQAKKNCHK
jgi:hypothetical protein